MKRVCVRVVVCDSMTGVHGTRDAPCHGFLTATSMLSPDIHLAKEGMASGKVAV